MWEKIAVTQKRSTGKEPVRTCERRTVFQEIAIQVQAYVRLQELRESFQNLQRRRGSVRLSWSERQKKTHHVHVDAVGVSPRVLEILLQTLSQRVRNLVEANEFPDTQQLRVVSRRARVKSLYDRRNISKDRRIHQSC